MRVIALKCTWSEDEPYAGLGSDIVDADRRIETPADSGNRAADLIEMTASGCDVTKHRTVRSGEQTIEDLALDQRCQRADCVGSVEQSDQPAYRVNQVGIAGVDAEHWQICTGHPAALARHKIGQHRGIKIDLAAEIGSLGLAIEHMTDQRQVAETKR